MPGFGYFSCSLPAVAQSLDSGAALENVDRAPGLSTLKHQYFFWGDGGIPLNLGAPRLVKSSNVQCSPGEKDQG